MVIAARRTIGTRPARALRPHASARAEKAPDTVFPCDIRELVDPCTLALLIQDETEALEAFPRVEMLQMLSFAYAVNILASEEISAACRIDPALRWLSKHEVPFPYEITSFRRRNRLQLESLLTRVLARIIDGSLGAQSAVSYTDLLITAKERLDTARHLDNCD